MILIEDPVQPLVLFLFQIFLELDLFLRVVAELLVANRFGLLVPFKVDHFHVLLLILLQLVFVAFLRTSKYPVTPTLSAYVSVTPLLLVKVQVFGP